MPNSPLLAPEELASRIGRAVLLDVRTGADARSKYAAGHLPGAIFVDLDHDLADEPTDPANGGRHPLPSPETFATTVGRWGVGPDDDVIVYDAQSGGNAASRAWWMLRALGHRRSYVLDGGIDAAIGAGVPTTTEIPMPVDRGPYPTKGWSLPTIDADTADVYRTDPTKVLIDARSAARFRGEVEPIDPIKGHIPGAVNLFHLSLVGADGRMLPKGSIEERVREVVGERPIDAIAVHCGSGVTACHLVLAMEHAGLGVPALYVGSWSEWCRSGRPRGPSESA